MSSMDPYGWTPAGSADPQLPAPTVYLHTVAPGDTFYNIAQRYGSSVSAIQRANPGVDPNNLMIGSVLRVPAPAYYPYQVVAGDTLWSIGQRFGVDWRTLAAINDVADPNNLMVGAVLSIPIA